MTKKQKIIETADRLKIDPQWLSALIHLETAGTYDPFIKNPVSSARGLIQVIDSTAADMFGVSDSLALSNKYPTFDSYMDNVVYPYLKKYGPYTNIQQLAMAVFLPEYRNVDPSRELPQWAQNANPGIVTVNDYVNLVKKRLGKWPQSKALPLLGAAVLGAGIYLITRR